MSGSLYNCAVIFFGGRVVGVVPKTFIPNYGEFYEKRWFDSADGAPESITSAELGIGGESYTIPVGSSVFDLGGVKVASRSARISGASAPSTLLCLAGAEVIANLSASNEVIAKREYRRQIVTQQSAGSICAYAYCSAGSLNRPQTLFSRVIRLSPRTASSSVSRRSP